MSVRNLTAAVAVTALAGSASAQMMLPPQTTMPRMVTPAPFPGGYVVPAGYHQPMTYGPAGFVPMTYPAPTVVVPAGAVTPATAQPVDAQPAAAAGPTVLPNVVYPTPYPVGGTPVVHPYGPLPGTGVMTSPYSTGSYTVVTSPTRAGRRLFRR